MNKQHGTLVRSEPGVVGNRGRQRKSWRFLFVVAVKKLYSFESVVEIKGVYLTCTLG